MEAHHQQRTLSVVDFDMTSDEFTKEMFDHAKRSQTAQKIQSTRREQQRKKWS
jgi:hypothetical protein